MQYDLQVFVQDYQLYYFVLIITEKDYRHYFVNDNGHDYMVEINDQYYENMSHFLVDLLKRTFLVIVDNNFDSYSNKLLTKKRKDTFATIF